MDSNGSMDWTWPKFRFLKRGSTPTMTISSLPCSYTHTFTVTRSAHAQVIVDFCCWLNLASRGGGSHLTLTSLSLSPYHTLRCTLGHSVASEHLCTWEPFPQPATHILSTILRSCLAPFRFTPTHAWKRGKSDINLPQQCDYRVDRLCVC